MTSTIALITGIIFLVFSFRVTRSRETWSRGRRSDDINRIEIAVAALIGFVWIGGYLWYSAEYFYGQHLLGGALTGVGAGIGLGYLLAASVEWARGPMSIDDSEESLLDPVTEEVT